MSHWLEVVMPAAPEGLDDLTAGLVMEGFESFQTEDDRVILYLPPDDAGGLARLRARVPSLTARIRCEDEWAEAWKRYYKPTPIGKRLLIQPAWLPPENPGARAVYLNDPGMSFGTGLHASTRLCLEMLETLDLGGKSVLDIGCGSGILGLCALLLGAGAAAGVDIDPYAVRTAEKNARLNGVEKRFGAAARDILSDPAGGRYDVVFSNIVADVIISLMPLLPECDIWIASGIVEERLDEVLAAAETEGLSARCVRAGDGWAAVMFGGVKR